MALALARRAHHIAAMQSQNPLFADFVKLANAAAGTLAGMTREAGESARERMREALGGADFVSRDEFEAVKAMAARAREQAEALEARLAALEAAMAARPTAADTRAAGPAPDAPGRPEPA